MVTDKNAALLLPEFALFSAFWLLWKNMYYLPGWGVVTGGCWQSESESEKDKLYESQREMESTGKVSRKDCSGASGLLQSLLLCAENTNLSAKALVTTSSDSLPSKLKI